MGRGRPRKIRNFDIEIKPEDKPKTSIKDLEKAMELKQKDPEKFKSEREVHVKKIKEEKKIFELENKIVDEWYEIQNGMLLVKVKKGYGSVATKYNYGKISKHPQLQNLAKEARNYKK